MLSADESGYPALWSNLVHSIQGCNNNCSNSCTPLRGRSTNLFTNSSSQLFYGEQIKTCQTYSISRALVIVVIARTPFVAYERIKAHARLVHANLKQTGVKQRVTMCNNLQAFTRFHSVNM